MNNKNRSIRIGMICPYWLPRHGGGEQYDHRLALELLGQGFDVRVFTATAAQEGKDNGQLEVSRHVSRGAGVHSSWRLVFRDPKSDAITQLMNHYALMNEAVQWCVKHDIQIALIGNPWQQTELVHARELYLQLKALGIKTGAIHFDLAPAIETALVKAYHRTRNWDTAKEVLQRSLKKIHQDQSRLQALHIMGSPLFFEPDFVLSCSEWSSAFIDLEQTTPKFILHPILDREHWSGKGMDPEGLAYRDVLMINPSARKGPELMANLIKSQPSNLNFRVLKGGWGDSFKTFIPAISQTPAYLQGRVDLLEYVVDIRQAYRAAGLIFFPSLFEGYGMTAVEPMYAGTPVVSSNHPAILEAVGSGALTLCPYHDAPQRWTAAVQEVLSHRDIWSQRARQRTLELEARQSVELAQLCNFLTELGR